MPNRITTADFIRRAREVHGDRYDYSKASYVAANSYITIICREHGEFEQWPSNHYAGKGCRKCGLVVVERKKRHSLDRFLKDAREVHGDRYDYSQVAYVSALTKVTIVCPDHGPFSQLPSNHIREHGCPKCGRGVVAKKLGHSLERFIEDARQAHGDRYDYTQVEYVNALTKVTIICPDHGPFEQNPANHIREVGCPGCATSGFDPTKPSLLYYLAVKSDSCDTLYKIGITNFSIQKRFSITDYQRIRVVKTWHFERGYDAVERETEILNQFASKRYYGPEILVSGGNTELFTLDVLGLDEGGHEYESPVIDGEANLLSRPIQRDFGFC